MADAAAQLAAENQANAVPARAHPNIIGAPVAKQPPTYTYGKDFALFFSMFTNYCNTVNLPAEFRYALFLTFLGPKCFQIITRLELDRDDIIAAYPQLLRALQSASEPIPPRLSIKYRTQKPNESLQEYAFALETLADRAFDDADVKDQQMLDTFCTGILDAGLSVKLLQEEHADFQAAVEMASRIQQAVKVRKYMHDNRINVANSDKVEILEVSSKSQCVCNSSPSSVNAIAPRSKPQEHPNTQNMQVQGTLPQAGPSQPAGLPQYMNTNHGQAYPPQTMSYGSHNHNNSHQGQTQYNNNANGFNNNQSNNRYNSRFPTSSSDNGRGLKTCWFCERPGHVIRNCFAYQNSLQDRATNNNQRTRNTGPNWQPSRPGPSNGPMDFRRRSSRQ